MSDRILVCFRCFDHFEDAERYLKAARTLGGQAAALGGRLIMWGGISQAFEFEIDAIEDAVELAVSVARGSVAATAYGVGVSEGRLEQLESATSRAALVWGPALARVEALARAAEPGEVLVDPLLAIVRSGEALTEGTRQAMSGVEAFEGLVLDVKHPFRSALAAKAASLETPELIGRTELAAVLAAAGGGVTIVRADRGCGGTRFLEEIARALAPSRVLMLLPHALGEPLGALRTALSRAEAAGQSHPAKGVDALEALLAGEGLDVESAADILLAWLEPGSSSGPTAILIDDASDVDWDTLDAVVRARSRAGAPCRIVLRLVGTELMPAPLTPLPSSAEVRLGPLSPADATLMARRCMRGEIDEPSAARWGKRGGGLPLGIVEAIYEALEAGELLWVDGRATDRIHAAAGARAQPVKHWAKRRFGYCDANSQALLVALAVLGGEAEVRDLAEVIKCRTQFGIDVDATVAALASSGWVRRVDPSSLRLLSSTHRDAVVSTLQDDDFMRWHAAAALVLEASGRPLGLASATVHAVLAGDPQRAVELSDRAAAVTSAAGLERAATAFEEFAVTADVAVLVEQNLLTAQLESARAAPSWWPADDAVPTRRRGAEEIGGAARPVPRPTLPVPAPARVEAGTVSHAEAPRPRTEPPPSTGQSAAGGARELAGGAPRRASANGDLSMVAALRAGDADAIERRAARLRVDTRRSGLADRLEAMATLARGDTGDALRRLRLAAEEARKRRSPDQCRALLTLAVALTSAQRGDEALLTALEALARARELSDERGEEACARLVAQLARGAGREDIAQAWGRG